MLFWLLVLLVALQWESRENRERLAGTHAHAKGLSSQLISMQKARFELAMPLKLITF